MVAVAVRPSRNGAAEREAYLSFTRAQYIMQTSPYKNLTTEQYYLGYPHDALPALTKWYCTWPGPARRRLW